MRWTLRISFLLLLAWAIFMVSPFVALYDLNKAVEAKDMDRISERVNFRALGYSLSRQILGAHLSQRDLAGLDRQLAAEAGAAAFNPIVEQFLTPQALADLLEDGWPQAATGGQGGAAPGAPLQFNFSSMAQAWKIFISSESQGFRSITIPLPADRAKEQQFRLTMRLRGTTWRLTGIELPQDLRDELAKRAVTQ